MLFKHTHTHTHTHMNFRIMIPSGVRRKGM